MAQEMEARRRPDVLRTYATDRIEVVWEPSRCTHVGRCFRSLPEVFDPGARPWIRADAVDPDTLADVVVACPTGALRFRRLDGGPQEDELVGGQVRVGARSDGPLEIRGPVLLTDGRGDETLETRVWLCRCGASANKPFCDDSHIRVGFRDPER